MEALNEKAIEATVRFLERKGCEVVDRKWAGPEGIGAIDLVAVEDGELVFVDVAARRSTDGFPEAHVGRELREVLAAKWLGEHSDEYADASVRFDDVAMMVMDDDRALLRRHVNCFGTMDPAICRSPPQSCLMLYVLRAKLHGPAGPLPQVHRGRQHPSVRIWFAIAGVLDNGKQAAGADIGTESEANDAACLNSVSFGGFCRRPLSRGRK